MKQILLILWSYLPILCCSFVPLIVTQKSWQNRVERGMAAPRQSKQSTGYDIIDRLDLSCEFSRWKFLQDTMEDDIASENVNEILYLVLKSFIDNPRETQILTEEQINVLEEELFQIEDNIGFISVLPLGGEYNEDHEKTLKLLDTLQPDPVENEDDFRSCWDILVEIYGREATKFAQKSEDIEFKHRSNAVRLLLHYDFLTEGVGKLK